MIPFILSLYLALVLTRWWALRVQGIGKVLDATETCLVVLASLVPGKEHQELHDQIVKYAMASVSFVVNSARGIKDSSRIGPQGDNLLTAEEMDIVNEIPYRPRAAVMWAWITALIVKTMEDH